MEQRADVFRGGRGGDGEAQAALAGLLDQRCDAGPQRQAAGFDEAQVVARLGGVEGADQPVQFGPGGEVGRAACGVVADAFLAAGDGEQLAVQGLVPVPVQPEIGEGVVERRAMAVALGVGQRAVDIENQCLQWVHGGQR